ncbi:MAG: hypothetical protein ACRYFS_17290 [Janthinobacterium lividum]
MPRDIDLIIAEMARRYPNVCVQQLQVKHQADDDGLWYFWQSDSSISVQIESSSGSCPFLIETDENDTRAKGKSVAEVICILEQWLHLGNGVA